ncbi:MAG: c-type cytochrome biogenesis protein CcsB, partial [Desulfobacterales bacterium]
MEVLIIVTILFYMLSAAGYFAYLFFQEDYLHRAGYLLVLAGFICHTFSIVYNGITSGGFPVRNLHETLSIAGWTVAGFFLVFQSRVKLNVLGIYAAPLIALIMIAVSQVPNTPS